MIKLVKIFFLLIILTMLQACSGVRVSQDYEQGYNFLVLKTFSWKENKNHEYGFKNNELVDTRIRAAIVNQFGMQQYTYIDSGVPDFYISYHFSIEQKISTQQVSGGVSMGRGSFGRYGSVGISTGTQVDAYDQGTLLIDVTDASSNKLIWRGISTQMVSEHSSPEKSTKQINETVKKLLAQFPPK